MITWPSWFCFRSCPKAVYLIFSPINPQCAIYEKGPMPFAPAIHKQVLAGRRWALVRPPTRRRLFVRFVQSDKTNLGTEGALPWPLAEGSPKKRRICISSAGGLIYRRNVNGISYLVACNPLQRSSAAGMVLLHTKVLNHHGGSVRMTLDVWSDIHLRPQSHRSFNTTS